VEQVECPESLQHPRQNVRQNISSSHSEKMAALRSAQMGTTVFSRRFHSPALRAALFLAGE